MMNQTEFDLVQNTIDIHASVICHTSEFHNWIFFRELLVFSCYLLLLFAVVRNWKSYYYGVFVHVHWLYLVCGGHSCSYSGHFSICGYILASCDIFYVCYSLWCTLNGRIFVVFCMYALECSFCLLFHECFMFTNNNNPFVLCSLKWLVNIQNFKLN